MIITIIIILILAITLMLMLACCKIAGECEITEEERRVKDNETT